MSELEQLIETANQLSRTLEGMAANEKRFGWNISHMLDQLSYDSLIIANNLSAINDQLVGGVA